MKFSLLLAVLLAALSAQSQDPKFYPVQFGPDATTSFDHIHFFCSEGYDKNECARDLVSLHTALAPYPLRLLGGWSFYLVVASNWKPLATSHGGVAVSPAFSLLLGKATVMDGSLFSGKADRKLELEKWSGLSIPMLVDVTVTHELGHAICQEKNERLANEYGKQLRAGKLPSCVQISQGVEVSAQR